MHHGKCRLQCLWSQSQDIFTSAAQIWTVLVLNCLSQEEQLYGGEERTSSCLSHVTVFTALCDL